MESFWQQNQFVAPSAATPQQPQWPGQSQPEVPMSMWDFQQSQPLSSPAVNQPILINPKCIFKRVIFSIESKIIKTFGITSRTGRCPTSGRK